MKAHRKVLWMTAVLCLCTVSLATAQSPGKLYSWDTAVNNVQQWLRSSGTNSATLANSVAGELTITETGAGANAGAAMIVNDNGNKIKETITGGSGGLDLTGLDYLQYDIGHNGSGNINVQFFVQATPSSTFLPLGPDLVITPGIATYQVPLTGLTNAQRVYVRTLGIQPRAHTAIGNVVWTIQEVRSGGTPDTVRDLATFTDPTIDGGLQGSLVNGNHAAVLGNDGSSNQTGLTYNAAGTGSVQWTDIGGLANGGAQVGWGNGTAFNANTFNNRETDASNYNFVTVRMSASDPLGSGGSVDVFSLFRRNNFQDQSLAPSQALPIDGQYHDLTFSLAGLTLMDAIDLTCIKLGLHTNNLVINVDNVRFNAVPEPASLALLGLAAISSTLLVPRSRRGR